MKIRAFHYFVLFFILALGAGMFFLSSGAPGVQATVGIITALAYIAWGIIHHALWGDLHPKIVIEYVLIGGIAIVLFLTMVE